MNHRRSTPSPAPPTVLIDPGSYDCRNFGDLAMLQVAVARWKALWPSAAIGVITAAPGALASSVPHAIPVGFAHRSAWLNTHVLGRLHRRLPARAASTLEDFEQRLRLNAARPLENALSVRYRLTGQDASGVAAFLRWIRQADVVALTGGGAVADAFSVKASMILDTLHMAASRASRHGRPITAVFGHGFGPMDGAALRRKAAAVLPRADFISIREARASGPLLRQLGVREDRVLVTGDDAIELAYEERRSQPGRSLGVNVRLAYYAETDAETLQVLGRCIASALDRHGAAPVPLPISRQPGGARPHNAEKPDAAAIAELLAGIGHPVAAPAAERPVDVIRDAGRCRTVVTGSYHGAVFALAQGIPAVALMRSAYYRAKFAGLADQFGRGVHPVDMSEPGWGHRLDRAIDDAWMSADLVRPLLLEAAVRQIELSRRAYRIVASLAAPRASAAATVAALAAGA
jgi:colanic acid/amylovoran biosynthesis protein